MIQIQRAKWLLEHELAQNRERRAREAAAKDAASNKRKADQISEESPANPQSTKPEENPSKKAKVEKNLSDPSPATPVTVKKPERPSSASFKPDSKPRPQTPLHPPSQPAPQSASQPPINKPTPTTKATDGSVTPKTTLQKKTSPKDKAPDAAVPLRDTTNIIQETPATVPPANVPSKDDKPTDTAKEGWQDDFQTDEFGLESFFPPDGIVSDQNDGTGFDLAAGSGALATAAPFGSSGLEESNLELLPGLESYANATGDDLNNLNLPPTTSGVDDGMPVQSSDAFDLPEMPEDSSYLFADGELGDDSFLDGDWQDDLFKT